MTPTFISRTYTSSDGLSLHFRDYGGPGHGRLAVVCIPGLTRNARDFEDLAPHLARQYRVICPDLRGRGQSAYATDPMTYVPPVYVHDIHALLNAAGLKQAVLVGTSLGGIVGMIMAATMPHRFLGLVLNDVGPELDPKGLARIGSVVGKEPVVGLWSEAAALLRSREQGVYPDYGDAEWTMTARRRMVEAPGGGLRFDYDPAIAKPFAVRRAPLNLWPFFQAINLPVLAMRGATSDILSADVLARMKQAMPMLEQIDVPNRGHVPTLDEPIALAAIDAFLARLPASLSFATRLRRGFKGAMFTARLRRRGS